MIVTTTAGIEGRRIGADLAVVAGAGTAVLLAG